MVIFIFGFLFNSSQIQENFLENLDTPIALDNPIQNSKAQLEIQIKEILSKIYKFSSDK